MWFYLVVIKMAGQEIWLLSHRFILSIEPIPVSCGNNRAYIDDLTPHLTYFPIKPIDPGAAGEF